MASASSKLPPIVPWLLPSAVTTIFAPRCRGEEPRTSTIVASTAARLFHKLPADYVSDKYIDIHTTFPG